MSANVLAGSLWMRTGVVSGGVITFSIAGSGSWMTGIGLGSGRGFAGGFCISTCFLGVGLGSGMGCLRGFSMVFLIGLGGISAIFSLGCFFSSSFGGVFVSMGFFISIGFFGSFLRGSGFLTVVGFLGGIGCGLLA